MPVTLLRVSESFSYDLSNVHSLYGAVCSINSWDLPSSNCFKPQRPTNRMNGTAQFGFSFIPRSRYIVVVAVAALCLCIIAITDVAELPFESMIGRALSSSLVSSDSIIASISKQGYSSLFILMTLESASIPIPSEVVLPFAGYLVYLGTMNFALAVMVSTVAGLVGALADYALALKLGRPFVDGLLRRVGVKPESIDGAERWMNSRGYWGVFIARFIPGLRSIISIPAGVFKMGAKPFIITTLVGSFIWSAVLIYAGYSSGSLWSSVLSTSAATLSNAILIAVAFASVGYIAYYAYATRARDRTSSLGL